MYSLGQHSYDADCSLFLHVFLGDVEETVRDEQAALEQEVGGWPGARTRGTAVMAGLGRRGRASGQLMAPRQPPAAGVQAGRWLAALLRLKA